MLAKNEPYINTYNNGDHFRLIHPTDLEAREEKPEIALYGTLDCPMDIYSIEETGHETEKEFTEFLEEKIEEWEKDKFFFIRYCDDFSNTKYANELLGNEAFQISWGNVSLEAQQTSIAILLLFTGDLEFTELHFKEFTNEVIASLSESKTQKIDCNLINEFVSIKRTK